MVAEGTSDRLRAILLTTLTTVIGLLPLAYGIGGTDEWMAPMALVLGYGILFATPLTLILVPCLYNILAGARDNPEANILTRVKRVKLSSVRKL